MDIFQALVDSHESQRRLVRELPSASAATLHELFHELKLEMAAHETAEERAFYVPLIEHDDTVDPARHGISEHHQMDEMVECLDKLQEGSPEWQAELGKLLHKLEHHLREEEEKFFPEARRVLDDAQAQALGGLYREEYVRLLDKEVHEEATRAA
ncbi:MULTISPECIES: hemerythrin domain-containing protein [Ramlibacter]|uniref:Hemerythrin domain-containing protein n=1 Tax=Ramlibacter aquaticus TaxID=2780094 RepID=A0ABR9SI07_9BURK|nr:MULTISPECIES: hemerythrin domain-containing protein [Ramlibacter]MBE7941985.1 hemerythrin domain-containing protein [Ramlibacter aquaticus]